MQTRHAVLGLVLVVTTVMGIRGVVAILDGDVGIFARQVAVGGFILAFGVALYRNWDAIGT
ncbi:hypothetical protein SAMN04487948_1014 [Halogranum amylolyticum]|uniref:DUF8073 domain-containing protein n=1 Tax=Halogranum amylolyticum TaxID=660520 RepID=A0A1H8MPG5_9EURY|nr:hypothetical protein [Halogranum amylolyticum]SEO19199.1 hypothetical protein SAMN04487948_1014 [Halogranum amylolyticum]